MKIDMPLNNETKQTFFCTVLSNSDWPIDGILTDTKPPAHTGPGI